MNTNFTYSLTIHQSSQNKGVEETNSYEHTIHIRFLRKENENASYYSNELNRRFEDKRALSFVYEFELRKARLFLSPRLAKGSEFLRATLFRYDWLQLEVRRDGIPTSIHNADELVHRWEHLKDSQRKHYKEGYINNYFDLLDKEFETTNEIWDMVSCYFYLGLVFPQIPMEHESSWVHKRLVKLSEHEDEFFEEQLNCSKMEGEVGEYIIKGNILPNSATTLLKYEGSITKNQLEVLPEKASVDIVLQRGALQVEWNFVLQRISE